MLIVITHNDQLNRLTFFNVRFCLKLPDEDLGSVKFLKLSITENGVTEHKEIKPKVSNGVAVVGG